METKRLTIINPILTGSKTSEESLKCASQNFEDSSKVPFTCISKNTCLDSITGPETSINCFSISSINKFLTSHESKYVPSNSGPIISIVMGLAAIRFY